MSDLISRKELLQRTVYNPCHAPYITKQDVIECPTAEPKVGKWIKVKSTRGGYECSECNNYAPRYQGGGEHLSNYCPHCGAKMERSE